MKNLRVWQLLLCILIGIQGSAFGQATGASLRGEITDPTGAAVRSAVVSVVNVNTGLKLQVTSNSEGDYILPAIPPGDYRLEVNGAGFKAYEQSGIHLAVGESATANVHLVTGTVTQTVSVNANAELINTTTPEISQTISSASIQALPLNGRDPGSLVQLSPGTINVLNTAAGFRQGLTVLPTAQAASTNGGKQGSTYYMLDGAPNNDVYMGLAGPFPNPDATQEFTAVTNNFSAQYGFSAGGVVLIQTRSGANKFHGDIFEFVRNQDFNAADYFTKVVNTLKRNQFGGSIGGPILHNKLFFFFNYQGTREVASATPAFAASFTPAMLAGDFSALLPNTPIYDPTTGKPFPGNIIPQDRINQDALKLARLFPVSPSGTGAFYIPEPSTSDKYDEFTGRMDYDITPSNRLFARWYSNFYSVPGNGENGNLITSFAGDQIHYIDAIVSDTWTINPSTINIANVYEMNEEQRQTPTMNTCLSQFAKGLVGLPGECDLQGLYVSGVGGSGEYIYQSSGSNPRSSRGLDDKLITTIGKHTLAMGGTVQRNYDATVSPWEAVPQMEFYGAATGVGLADMVLGDASYFAQGAGDYGAEHQYQTAAFIQDEYQVLPNLTIDAGIRWEPDLAPSIVNGRAAAYIPGEQSTRFPNAPKGLVFPGDHGVTSGIYASKYNVFEPRIGFAWQPKDLPNTSVRGAFGLFREVLPMSNLNHITQDAPFSPTYQYTSAYTGYAGGGVLQKPITFDNPWSSPGVNFPGGKSPFPPFASLTYVPPSNVEFASPVGSLVTFSTAWKTPMMQSWNLSVSQQVGRSVAFQVIYVGSETEHDVVQVDRNPGIYANKGTRQNPQFSQILTSVPEGTSSFNALEAHIQKSMSHGLQFGSSFTWEKVMDDSSSSSLTFDTGDGVTDPFNIGANRGESDLNIPVTSVTNFIYDAPSLRHSNPFVRDVFGGWSVSGILTLQEGTPFTVYWTASANNSGAGVYADRASLTGAPVNLKQGNRSNWLKHYYNTAAFEANAPGTFGDSARNMLRGPGYSNLDMGLMKNWSFARRYRLQFRWEAFNALNHVNFNNPNNTASNGSAITSDRGPRLMQGALKLYF